MKKCQICKEREAECIPLIFKGIHKEYYYKLGAKSPPMSCFLCARQWREEKKQEALDRKTFLDIIKKLVKEIGGG